MDIFLEPDRDVIEARVPRRATLAGILRTHEVGENLIVAMVDATRPVFDPRRLRAGQPYRLVRTFDGRLRQFEYEIDRDRFLRIVRPGAPGTELEGEIVPYTREHAQIAMHGEIDAGTSSLVAAIHEAGEQVQLAIEIAEVFAGEIDFNNDLRQGDSFDVLFEKSLREDEFAGYGSIVAAEFHNDGRRIRAIQFTPPRRSACVLRRAGPVSPEALSPLAVHVPAARHVEVFLPPLASGARRLPPAPRGRLWGAPRDAGGRRGQRCGRVGGPGW